MSSRVAFIEHLEGRRMLAGQYPLGIGFNDEALWDENFNTAVATCQQLGIKTVRLWMPIVTYNDRPTPWDDAPAAGMPDTGLSPTGGTTSPSRVLRRAFQLKQLGFNILMVFANETGALPTSNSQVGDYFTYMLSVPQSPGSSTHLSDAVDRWEVGNEPDLKNYWNDPSLDVNVRVKNWVKQFLVPGAEVLKAAGETVVSAGPSSSPTILKTMLDSLNSLGKMGLIDYVGFHPYATFNPNDATGANLQRDNILRAKSYADAYGKQMIATEWNVRGYGNYGAYDSTWATAIDQNYRNYVRDSFESQYYFCLINNWASRGGTTSARPGAILQHPAAATKGVTPTSSPAVLNAYYSSGLVIHNPFYNVVAGWRLGSVRGTVFNDLNGNAIAEAGETGRTGQTVFIDFNNNGTRDSGESTATTDSTGAFTLNYDLATAPPGTFNVIAITPDGWQQTTSTARATVTAAGAVTGVNIGQRQTTSNNYGTITGTAFHDKDADGVWGAGELPVVGRTVYLDVDGDRTLSASDLSTVTDAQGSFTLIYNTTALATGDYLVAQSLPAYWDETTTPGGYVVNITRVDQPESLLFGSRPQAGAVSGKLFNDANSNGTMDAGESALAGRTVYVDANNNKSLDAGELSAATDATGQYTIAYTLSTLAPATYSLRQVLPAGWSQTAPALNAAQSFVASAGALATGADFGSVQVSTPVLGSIGGYVWSDTDGNGVINNTEPLLSARVVWIDTNKDGLQSTGEPSTTTDASGNYKFSNLPAGSYRVRRVMPAGYRVSSPLAGYWDIALAAGQNVTTANIGATQRVRVTGNLFLDANKNALQDNGESALPNWAVYLDANGNGALDSGERTTLTDSAGNWAFDGLVAGTFKFKVSVLAGYSISTPGTNLQMVTLSVGQTKTGVKFGVKTIA